jgi:hypothetical protein
MTQPLRPERVTQNRVVQRFTAPVSAGGLGYRGLGDWHQREHSRGIETSLLRDNLTARGYSAAQIGAALQKLETAADSTGITLYAANLRTYQLLRYGVPVQTAAGQAHETVHLVDWANPEANDFALAEEVTLKGGYPTHSQMGKVVWSARRLSAYVCPSSPRPRRFRSFPSNAESNSCSIITESRLACISSRVPSQVQGLRLGGESASGGKPPKTAACTINVHTARLQPIDRLLL